ncbi:MAG TPA: hypothetical protein VFA33_09590 [Bryobacteraceae bacterium]|nr:hypothetical protein [Bryobacteraceae bacterium]
MCSSDLRITRRPVLRLLALTILAVFVHGYHLGVDDAEIYIPAIKRAADPTLYPFAAEFFMFHAHLSFFPNLVGGSARFSRLPVDLVIFLWHGGCIFLLLLASWRLARVCFESQCARWSAVALLAGALSVPVAGTALVIMDPYVTARSLSTPAGMFAIAGYASGRWKRAAAWLVFTALIHPQMMLYAAVLIGFLELARRRRPPEDAGPGLGMACLISLPGVFDFQPPRGAAREALFSRTYFFVSNWAWYEWVGVVAPLALLGWFAAHPPRGTTPVFRRLAGVLVPFGLSFTLLALLLTFPERLENATRLQPMRSFHLLYVIFFVLLGGLVGEYLLRARGWHWLALFAPLAGCMWLIQLAAYPASLHIEWPGAAGPNGWTRAFLWIRGHTPKDAVFALDPDYMLLPGADEHGFRAIAERSALADRVKDSGAVSLFPQLADDWKSEVQAQEGWEHFGPRDFERLARHYPVTWIVTRRPPPAAFPCPYQQGELAVCRIEEADPQPRAALSAAR